MPDNIDYSFISAREGGSRTAGYVPAANLSSSGVTVATGFDLGARNESDLKNLNLSSALVSKLKPYLGLKGAEAKKLLNRKPLTLTKIECENIDKATKTQATKKLVNRYDAAIKGKHVKFYKLPTEAQTVIASVAYQYGDLGSRAPKFWKTVVDQDWAGTVKVLKNFGDMYPSRRKLEANLLSKIVIKAKP